MLAHCSMGDTRRPFYGGQRAIQWWSSVSEPGLAQCGRLGKPIILEYFILHTCYSFRSRSSSEPLLLMGVHSPVGLYQLTEIARAVTGGRAAWERSLWHSLGRTKAGQPAAMPLVHVTPRGRLGRSRRQDCLNALCASALSPPPGISSQPHAPSSARPLAALSRRVAASRRLFLSSTHPPLPDEPKAYGMHMETSRVQVDQ